MACKIWPQVAQPTSSHYWSCYHLNIFLHWVSQRHQDSPAGSIQRDIVLFDYPWTVVPLVTSDGFDWSRLFSVFSKSYAKIKTGQQTSDWVNRSLFVHLLLLLRLEMWTSSQMFGHTRMNRYFFIMLMYMYFKIKN